MAIWQPIETAPFDVDVWVNLGGLIFQARLGEVDDADDGCNQWLATLEGMHPPCWSDGACWAFNEDYNSSRVPLYWTPITSDKQFEPNNNDCEVAARSKDVHEIAEIIAKTIDAAETTTPIQTTAERIVTFLSGSGEQ